MDTCNAAGASYLTLAAAMGRADICRWVATESAPSCPFDFLDFFFFCLGPDSLPQPCHSPCRQNMFKVDCMGLTPMHHAVRNNHPDVVSVLVSFLRWPALTHCFFLTRTHTHAHPHTLILCAWLGLKKC